MTDDSQQTKPVKTKSNSNVIQLKSVYFKDNFSYGKHFSKLVQSIYGDKVEYDISTQLVKIDFKGNVVYTHVSNFLYLEPYKEVTNG